MKKLLLLLLIFLFISCKKKESTKGIQKTNNVYKILTKKQWENSQKIGYIITQLDKNDGFIHLSTSSQLAGTLSFFFSEHQELILLQLEQNTIKDHLVFEAPVPRGNRSGLFPHLNSDLKVNQIAKIWELKRGAFILPDEVLIQAEK
tara:strand:+ start:58 stop:498 length:441 start_codon:yes stop_codon:yes gene_type:complete